MYCMTDGIEDSWGTDYCFWVQTIYTLPKSTGRNLIESLRGNYYDRYENDPEPKYHAYYIWIPLVLGFQGALFHVPHWLWEVYEDGFIANLTADFVLEERPGAKKHFLKIDKALQEKIKSTANYVKKSMKIGSTGILNTYNRYAVMYIMAMFLNLINVAAQVVFIDYFLGGAFYNYGFKVMQMVWEDDEGRQDPLTAVFPRITKCAIQEFGLTAQVEYRDLLCINPLNILNEKVYVFLWFWLLFLCLLSVVNIVITLSLIKCPSMAHNLNTCVSENTWQYCRHAMHSKSFRFGENFFIYLLSKNMESQVFKMFLENLRGKEKPQHLSENSLCGDTGALLEDMQGNEKSNENLSADMNEKTISNSFAQCESIDNKFQTVDQEHASTPNMKFRSDSSMSLNSSPV